MLDPSDNIFIKWWNVSYLCGSIYILNKILYKRYTVWLGVGGGRGGAPSLTLESSDFLAQWLKFPPQLPSPPHTVGPVVGTGTSGAVFLPQVKYRSHSSCRQVSYNSRSFPHLGLVEDFGTFTPQRTMLPSILLKRSHYENIKAHATELVTRNILCLLYS